MCSAAWLAPAAVHLKDSGRSLQQHGCKGAAYTASAKSRNVRAGPASFTAAGDKLLLRVATKREAMAMMETKADASKAKGLPILWIIT